MAEPTPLPSDLTDEEKTELAQLQNDVFRRVADVLEATGKVAKFETAHGIPLSNSWLRNDGASVHYHFHSLQEVHIVAQWAADEVVADPSNN